jgi:hypothetical protein
MDYPYESIHEAVAWFDDAAIDETTRRFCVEISHAGP